VTSPRTTPEYVTDVPYVRGFEKDLSPTRIRLVAALNGFPTPSADDFDYCELGCAHGDTTATLAASYPSARFFGVDLNADHIASATALARGAGLENVRFLQKDFEELVAGDLPELDYIGAHGVLSWVGPNKRKAVLELASSRLKPGGLFEVGYNALPGWAAVEPLRQLILARSNLTEGSTLERARDGFEFAKLLCEKGAEYFRSNPAARAMVESMEKLGLPYVVHEYLHAHWVPMYFAQIAAEMAAHDLHFVGQTPLYLNYRDLAIPDALAQVFQGVGDRVTFESLKDFAVNESFRRDVYVKGRPARSDGATREYLDATFFGTLGEDGPLRRDVRLPHHTLHYAGPIFDELLPAIEEGASTVPSLASKPGLLGYGLPRIRDAVQRLLLGGQLSPMLEATVARSAAEGDTWRVPLPYNHWVLHHGVSGESPVVLASTAAGNGLELGAVEAVAMVLLTDVLPERRGESVRELCGRESFRLSAGGKAVVDREEQERVLLGEIEKFRARWLPKLLELGIVAETSPP
jgi:ubiquinone/menaquinone biosynthesis C-methylase UbiE